MRKVIFQMLITLDGYYEGPNREIDWHNVDAEFNDYAIEFLDTLDILLFGRVTYQMMAAWWPTEQAMTSDPIVAGKMNALQKIVVSKTLEQADWQNTKIIRDNVSEEVLKLKSQPGKNIAIFGSSDLAVTLMRDGLIDLYSIFVAPIVLGSGKPLFAGIKERFDLKLLKTKTFDNGNVLLYYEPAKRTTRNP